MAYTKHGRGAAGVGSARSFGDFGIDQLRQRDPRIIESLKLQKAQETSKKMKTNRYRCVCPIVVVNV